MKLNNKTQSRYIAVFSSSIYLVLLLISCDRRENIAVQPVKSTKAFVHGVLRNADLSPSRNATIQLYPISYNPETDTTTVPSAITDSNGQYCVDSLPLGRFNLFAENNNGLRCKKELILDKDTVSAGEDTLEIPGELAGTIRLIPTNNNGQIKIYLQGSPYHAVFEIDAENFVIPKVAPGDYHIIIQTSLIGYGIIDTECTIASSMTTLIGDTNSPSVITGGYCSFDSIYGHATITSISLDKTHCDSCYSIKYNFVPSDSAAVNTYSFNVPDTGRNITIHGGSYPPLSFINSYGIEVGNQYECYRLEQTTGTCTPVIFRFKGVPWPQN